jgi:ubiquitin
MSSPNSSSIVSSESSINLRSWLCPFAETSAATDDDHHPDTHLKSGFIATALEEASHVPYIGKGFISYQAALDGNKPFSQAFIDSERASTAKAIQQLYHLTSVLQDLATKAAALPDDAVPEDLRAELHLARIWVAKHRASLVSCHVFFKINYSLARDKPNDGIVEM